MSNLSFGVLDRMRGARLKKLGEIGPVLQGTIAKVGVRCGNPSCRCAKGMKHVSHILTSKVNGKTKSVYVPSGMLKEAKRWSKEFRKAKALLKEISDLNEKILKAHVSKERAAKRNLAVVRKVDRRNSRMPIR